jgi:peptide-methionine (S)-S-oxide reductase
MKWLIPCVCLIFLGVSRSFSEPMNDKTNQTQIATFGGGCFWCTEAMFERLEGVRSVTSGYAGGPGENPTYHEVCTGLTGHAEVIQVEFEPAKISYAELLEAFWDAHDPTTLNQQGADVGTQYRSIILYSNDEQKKAAEKSKAEAAAHFSRPIVTQIAPLTKFYPAEKYHQDYFQANPGAGYCRAVISPKLEKFLKKHAKVKH